MKKRIFFLLVWALVCSMPCAVACTGITLCTASGEPVVARTIEWAGDDLESCYAVVPRGYKQQSYLPDGTQNGKKFKAKYGYVGLAVQQPEFVVDGMNEAGLSAALFYFPEYGDYGSYDAAQKDKCLSDLQLVSWILSSFATIDEVKTAMDDVRVVTIDARGSTVHWRITEASGRQVVLEIVDCQARFYENTLGVLTNSPGFEWHLTNLNNYVNLSAGAVPKRQVGALSLSAFGGGSGFLGLPGDMTPPSRFVRAAFFQATAPRLNTTDETVIQAFHILNNFDIPIGAQVAEGQPVPDIPSATQWTVATDIRHRRIYYRTMHNATIRCFDFKTIDFGKIKFMSAPLDAAKRQPIEMVRLP
ncbi:MAG: linear amide C-N hydrolase [Paludibacteraceae bacterium]